MDKTDISEEISNSFRTANMDTIMAVREVLYSQRSEEKLFFYLFNQVANLNQRVLELERQMKLTDQQRYEERYKKGEVTND